MKGKPRCSIIKCNGWVTPIHTQSCSFTAEQVGGNTGSKNMPQNKELYTNKWKWMFLDQTAARWRINTCFIDGRYWKAQFILEIDFCWVEKLNILHFYILCHHVTVMVLVWYKQTQTAKKEFFEFQVTWNQGFHFILSTTKQEGNSFSLVVCLFVCSQRFGMTIILSCLWWTHCQSRLSDNLVDAIDQLLLLLTAKHRIAGR